MSEEAVIFSDRKCTLTLTPVAKERHRFVTCVDIVAGPFRGAIETEAIGWLQFRDDLVRLYRSLSGGAQLRCLEGFELTVGGDGKGHILAQVEAVADYYSNIRLKCEIALDQTQLPAIIKQIERCFLS